VPERLSAHPWGYAFPALALLGLFGMRWFAVMGAESRAFYASCAYLVGMLASVAFGLYPYVLPSSLDPRLSLTVQSAAAGDHGLRVALVWWIPGMLLVGGYFTFLYRHFRGKVQLEDEG